jgi:hypothetical protein
MPSLVALSDGIVVDQVEDPAVDGHERVLVLAFDDDERRRLCCVGDLDLPKSEAAAETCRDAEVSGQPAP